jgi:hypothetical protein
MEAKGLYEAGLNIRQVSKKMRLSESGAARALKRAGTQMRPCLKRRVLTETQETELCERYLEGATYEDLQALYGVSSTVVQATLRRHDIQPRTGWASYRTHRWMDRRGRFHTFKSSWELAYAEWLDEQGWGWEYEPAKLGLSECLCYTPDFGIYIDSQLLTFIEVKGWVTDDVRRRMDEFRRAYPTLPVVVVGPRELATMGLIEQKYINHPQVAEVARVQQKFENT